MLHWCRLMTMIFTLSMIAGDRVAGLEKANGQLRDRVKMLLAKSDTDDRLVDALRNEIRVSAAELSRISFVRPLALFTLLWFDVAPPYLCFRHILSSRCSQWRPCDTALYILHRHEKRL